MENLEICPFSSQNSSKSKSLAPREAGNKPYVSAERRIMKQLVPKRGDSSRRVSEIRKYLGVRQRPSGRWVAEIKESSQKLRLWLGTFDRAEDAAMAYDCAARLLRGRNAKTNFQCPIANTHEEVCGFLPKNPRAYQILTHAIVKNHHEDVIPSAAMPWKNQISSNITRSVPIFDTLVEETIVCCSTGTRSEEGSSSSGCCGASLESSKVYSSVVVAPSFSASFY